MLKKLFSALGFIGILIAVGVGGIIGKEILKTAASPSKPSQQEIEAELIKGFTDAANKFKQQLPMMVDKVTRLDRVTVGPGPRTVYHHTLLSYTSSDIDANYLQAQLRPIVKNHVCTTKAMKPSLQYGAIYAYSYTGSDGVKIGVLEFDRNDCGFEKI